jgi:acyl-CoA synthetase (AMP-forming)/AMP-acid ligase II
MNISMLLEMVADTIGDQVAVGALTYAQLLERATAGSKLVGDRLIAVDINSEAVPIGLFSAALAGVPYVPVNYRLSDEQLRAIVERAAPGTAVVDPDVVARLDDIDGLHVLDRGSFLDATAAAAGADRGDAPSDPDAIAVLLFTSGTTGTPKAAVLRHRHLTSYVLGSVEFLGSSPDDAALVSVPPYHIAGLAAVLSSVYSGRRIVYLSQFTPEAWVDVARREAITHAMVVPTMLGRILDHLEAIGEGLPALRHLSYGGGRMPVSVIERALTLLPDAGFVNAYGLTETSSTIAILTPDDHRAALASDDPTVRARLGSVGQPLPTIELEIRAGEIWVRGEQVSGEYLGIGAAARDDGWFPTNDGGRLDDGGYLFVDGRLDDVIVRGGENLSPGEIEDVLIEHPAVADAAVLGAPDDEWGEVPVAFVVPHQEVTALELQSWVRDRLRSGRVPARITFLDELPYSETGKLLRRTLRSSEVRSDR